MDRSFDAVIPAFVRYNKDLNASEKLLYAEIRALCNEHGYCWAGNKYFEDVFNTSDSSITRWIANLKKYNLIDVELIYEQGSKAVKQRIIKLTGIPEANHSADLGAKMTPPPLKNEQDINPVNFEQENIYITNTISKDIEVIKEIVAYLNYKVGTKYKYTTPSTQKHIRGRLSEKYTVDDFKTVIDKKCLEWKGTDMERYLCPDTLFSPSKFEKYLNQNIRQPVNKPMLDSRWTGGVGN